MKDKDKDQKLINDLIKKRKEENDAFAKLLSEISNKQQPPKSPKKKS
ncbi:MAG: hypothetical protein RIC30_00420 [Marinoscillum sp.]